MRNIIEFKDYKISKIDREVYLNPIIDFNKKKYY